MDKATLKKRVESTLPKPEVLPAEPVVKGKSLALAEAHKVQVLIPTLKTEVNDLVVEDDASYQYADELLERIRQPRKLWKGIWTRIQEKTIKPIRAGLDELYALDRDVDRPLEALETSVKAKMRDFKLEEQRQLQAEQAARDREQQRLLNEARKKEEAEQNARTAAMREKLRLQREALEAQAAEVEEQAAPEPVTAVHSAPRTKRAWRLKSIEDFCVGVAEGSIPAECIALVTPIINRYYKDNPEAVESWPGLEGFDDIQIAGR